MEVVHKALDYVEPLWALVSPYVPALKLDTLDAGLLCMLLALLWYAVNAVRTAVKDLSDDDDDAESNVVNAKHMHHIPFSFAQITALLLGLQNTGENPKRDEMLHWKEFILKVDLVFAARYHLMRRRLVEDFEPFDPNRTEAPEHPPSKMALVEDRFFSHLREMLERANFSLLSGEDAEDALSHNFINTIPIEPEWLKLDPVFSRYLDAHPDLAKEAPPFASRLWVFHRGMGAATFSGLLIMQKIDMLLMSLLGRCCGKRKKDKKKTGTSEASADASAAAAVAPSLAVPADGAGNSNSGVTYVEGVKRVSLESQMKTGGWGALFKPVFMQEPTFKEVFLVYRINAGRDAFHSSPNQSALYLKVFRDIPHADLEVLYPCKRTGLRPLDTIKFVGAGAFGVVSILMQRQAGELVGYSALVGFVGLLVTVLFNYQYQVSVYEQTTLRDIYSKSKDADSGAITYLMEEVEKQETKETLLAYFFLCQAGKALAPETLDTMAESFLSEMQTVYGHKESFIDFEVDDALKKLEDLKLVVQEGGKYTAIPLMEGIEELNRQWGSLITAE